MYFNIYKLAKVNVNYWRVGCKTLTSESVNALLGHPSLKSLDAPLLIVRTLCTLCCFAFTDGLLLNRRISSCNKKLQCKTGLKFSSGWTQTAPEVFMATHCAALSPIKVNVAHPLVSHLAPHSQYSQIYKQSISPKRYLVGWSVLRKLIYLSSLSKAKQWSEHYFWRARCFTHVCQSHY